jgi:hypothetical protein
LAKIAASPHVGDWPRLPLLPANHAISLSGQMPGAPLVSAHRHTPASSSRGTFPHLQVGSITNPGSCGFHRRFVRKAACAKPLTLGIVLG